MKSWQLRTLDGQLTQVAHDQMIVLQQLNRLQTTKNEEIAALRTAMYAIANALEMLNAVCSAFVADARDST